MAKSIKKRYDDFGQSWVIDNPYDLVKNIIRFHDILSINKLTKFASAFNIL